MKRAWVFVLTLFVVAGNGRAHERLWNLFDWRDGLPVSYVSGIAQDRDGFLWLGTPGGVVCFDGREMHRLTRGLAVVLPGSGAPGIYFLDAAGALFGFDDDRPVPVSGPDGKPLDRVPHGSVGGDGGLWVVHEGHLLHRSPSGSWSAVSDRFADIAGSLAALGPGREGTLLATNDRELLRFELDGSVRAVGPVAVALVAIDLADGRTVAATVGGEVLMLEKGSSRRIHARSARPIHFAERGDALWVAYDDALVVLRDGQDSDTITVREDIPAPGSLLVDREGSLWVGSWRGLLHFPEPDTIAWRPEHPVVGRSLARGPDFLVMTSWGETLLAEESPSGWKVGSAPVGSIAPACVDRNGHVFTAAGGILIEWTPDGQRREHPTPGHRGAWRCSPSSDGGRWIGTTGGLIMIEPDGRLSLLPGPGGGAPTLELPTYVPYEKKDGTLFVARGEQICSAPGATVRGGGPPDWICETLRGAESIRDMLETPAGHLWVATAKRGVFGFEEGRFEWFRASADLPTGWLAGLAPSPRGGVWIFGQGTVVRVAERPATEVGWEVEESLSAWEGLPTNNVVDLHEDDNGDVWLATDASLVRVPASARAAPPEPPRVVLVEALADGRPVRTAEGLELAQQRSRLELRFAALSYRDPGRIRYRSRLDPDEPWSAAVAEPVFRFEGFAAGRYEMEVQASLDQVNWSPSAATVGFRVPRPWYLQAWFLALIAIVPAAVVFVVSRARASVRMRLERQRVRIAGDLHDELGSGLGSIGILAGLVARENLDPQRRRQFSKQMQKVTGELSGSLTDLVWSLKPGASTLRSLLSHLVERGSDLFPEDQPSFALEIPEQMPSTSLSPSVRRNVSRIGLEALHNAARHSGARTVTLGLTRSGRRFVLTVTDDGRGLGGKTDNGARDGAHGLGLVGMRRRAAAIGAALAVVSDPGGGTQVRLEFDPQADERETARGAHDRAT